ncbi:MAG TPA: hypothetical protein VK581_10815, partial [Chthoniobacterales bacterium]|nr:hypothetical protein [Chthoniobacterales bacterium]
MIGSGLQTDGGTSNNATSGALVERAVRPAMLELLSRNLSGPYLSSSAEHSIHLNAGDHLATV